MFQKVLTENLSLNSKNIETVYKIKGVSNNMRMADYLKYCQNKISALEGLAENFDLAKATAMFQGTDAANIMPSTAEPPASDEVSVPGGSDAASPVQAEPVVKSAVNSSQADSTQNPSSTDDLSLSLNLSGNNLVQGLIFSEILGSPRSKRLRGNSAWNSRF
jgi:hypothetical protein